MKLLKLQKCMIAVMLSISLVVGMSACQSDDEPVIKDNDIEKALNYDESWLEPVDLTDNAAMLVNEFFTKMYDTYKERLAPVPELVVELIGGDIMNYDATYNHHGDVPCLIINSDEDFKNAFLIEVSDMPAIDFSKYTVVFGYVYGSYSARISVNKIRVRDADDGITIRVPLNHPYFEFCDYMPLFYWNVYPKFMTNKVTVNLVSIQHKMDGSCYIEDERTL